MVNKSIMIRPEGAYSNHETVATNIVQINPNDEHGYRGYMIIYSDLTNVKRGLEYETSTGQANRTLNGYRLNSGTYPVSSIVNSSQFLNELNLPRANADKQLYAYVFPMNEDGKILINDGSVFIYAIPKGFTAINGRYEDGTEFRIVEPKFTDKGNVYDYVDTQSDVPWVNIHMLSMYANTVYKQHNISVTTYVEPDTNLFSELIAAIFTGILWVIRSVLGLADIDVLVFNLGVRGSAAYNFGLMSENWWNVVLQYQLIFQAIAWVVLVCGFIKTLIDLNLSTINPQKRMSVYDTIQKFIVVGIGLVILIPAVQFLLECNNVLVELFASQIETSTLNMPSVSNALVQFIVGMTWITILLYINFIYIMRSITIALLIASGPFFISTIAFSHGGKSSLFTSWAKELLANIFVQSVHAFILSFLMQLLTSGTFLETFAIAISIIPLTEMFRNLIFAGAGGSTSQMANTAAGAMNRMGTAVGKGVVAAGGAAIGGIFGKDKGGPDGDGGGSGGSGGKGGGNKEGSTTGSLISNAAQSKINKMNNGTSLGSRMAKSMAQKAGKENPNAFMKGLGGTVDALGVAGMVAGAGMAEIASNMPDLQQGFADLALKGDYQGLGKTMDKVTTAQGKQVGGAAASSVNAMREHRNTQKATAATETSTTSQMGQAAVTNESGKNGQTAGGATMKTPELTGQTTLYKKTDKKIRDISGLSEDQQAAVVAGFNAGSDKKVEDSVVATEGGQGRVGKTYSYTDADGNRKSFFVQGQGVSDSVQEKSQTTAASKSIGGEQVRTTTKVTAKTAANGKQEVTAAMTFKQNKGKELNDQYLDANGSQIKGSGVYAGDDGTPVYVPQDVKSKSSDIISSYAQEQMGKNNGLVFEQRSADFSNGIASKYGTGPSGVVDMTTAQMGEDTNGAYVDAAMIASIGEQTGDGVYKVGNHTFNTGLTKESASQILQARGINGLKHTQDMMSYHQHNAPLTNRSLADVRQGSNGHPLAQYSTGIGKAGGPSSWTADGNGGGTMSFASRQAAATYFQAQGNTSMAHEIATMKADTAHVRGAHTFDDTGSGFSISFNGQELKAQGMKMEIGSNGQDMFVSSFDGETKDPFALNDVPRSDVDPRKYTTNGAIDATQIDAEADKAAKGKNPN